VWEAAAFAGKEAHFDDVAILATNFFLNQTCLSPAAIAAAMAYVFSGRIVFSADSRESMCKTRTGSEQRADEAERGAAGERTYDVGRIDGDKHWDSPAWFLCSLEQSSCRDRHARAVY
jgi:hypothetical protein